MSDAVITWWFECRACGYDSAEAGRVLFIKPSRAPICPLCAEDNGRAVRLELRPATEQEYRSIIMANPGRTTINKREKT